MKRFILAAAFVLAACGQQAQAPEEQGEASTVMARQSLEAGIGPTGAAGVTTALPMNVEALRAVAANYAIAEVEDQIEGDPFTAITLSSGGAEVFRVLPNAERTHVHAIVTRSPQARGPTEEIVGQTLFGVAPPEEVTFCLAEFVDGAPGFACSTAADGRFWRVYKLPEGYTGPNGTFEEIDPDVLHDATLAEMRWIAPRV